MKIQEVTLNSCEGNIRNYSVRILLDNGDHRVVPVSLLDTDDLSLIPNQAFSNLEKLDKTSPSLETLIKALSNVDISSYEEKATPETLNSSISSPLKAKIDELLNKLQWPLINNLDTYTNREGLVLLRLLQNKLGE